MDALVVCSRAFFTGKFRLLFSHAARREPLAAWEPRFDNPWCIVGASSTMNIFTGNALKESIKQCVLVCSVPITLLCQIVKAINMCMCASC